MIFRLMVSCPIHEGIVCIVDAIDKCNESCDKMLQEFLAFSASREANFKVLVTSRISPESLHQQPSFSIDLNLQKELGLDREEVINTHLQHLLQANTAFVEVEKDMVEEFQKCGTHLEVKLGFEVLKKRALQSTPRSTRDTLKLSRRSPLEICDCILKELVESPSWARTALCWIVHAFRPLKFDELSVAIAIREKTTSYSEIENDIPRDIARDLKQIFGGIVSTDHDEIRFVPQFIKDRLLLHLKLPNQTRFPLNLTHSDIARRCLAYLSFADFEELPSSQPVKASSQVYSPPGKFDLLGYATEYWSEHYQAAEERKSLFEDVLVFLDDSIYLRRWYQARFLECPRSVRRPRTISSLQVAAELGLTEIVAMLLSKDGGDHITRNDREAALEVAIEKNHRETAVELVKDGTTSERALGLAARQGNAELVRKLFIRSDMKASGTVGAPATDGAPGADGASGADGSSDTDGSIDSDNFSPFHIAALRGHTAVMEALLEAGAIPEPSSIFGDTPFSLAVKGGRLAALQQLLNANQNVALADHTEFSLLHLAAREGHIEILRELIKIGADPNAIGKDRSTPLLLAAAGGHAVLVRELLNNFGADLKATDEAGIGAVHLAAKNGHVRVFEQLCKFDIDTNAKDKQGSQPIHLAAIGGHFEVTKRLLVLGADPSTVDDYRLTPLHLATKGGYLRIVQELLKYSRNRPDPDANSHVSTGELGDIVGGKTQGSEVSEGRNDADANESADDPDEDSGNESVESSELEESSDESSDDSTDFSDDNSISSLIAQDFNEATPLHSAARRGFVEILRELLKFDTKCNIRSRHNLTPLNFAAKEGHLSVVKELLQHNADPNIADEEGSTPLHGASTAGNLSMVKTLLKFGADCNKTNDNRVSPLHDAARRGHIDVLEQLLEAGAEVEAANVMGQTPLRRCIRSLCFPFWLAS